MALLDDVYLGKWFGIPLYMHCSFWILFLLRLLTSVEDAGMMLCVFSIIILHEFGHCFASKKLGYIIRDIRLYLFGGVASGEIPTNPYHELVVALAGPAVNVLLIPLFFVGSYLHPFIGLVAYVNVVILLFNMLPFFPMDGGRVLRASLTVISGNRIAATNFASYFGQFGALLGAALAIVLPYPLFFLFAFFLYTAASAERQMVKNSLA